MVDRKEPTWENQLWSARQEPTRELTRHASVSTQNRHRCQECYCCAALTVLEERRATDEQAKLWLNNRKGIK